jgi:hypothetical protein
VLGAAEQGHEPDEALGLKVPGNGLGIVNVRFAGYARCSPDKV